MKKEELIEKIGDDAIDAAFEAVSTGKCIFPSREIPAHNISQSKYPTINGKKSKHSTQNSYFHKRYIFTVIKWHCVYIHYLADKYIHSKLYSNAHQSVFTKENNKYRWLVLEQKSQNQVEVRQTDRHGTITARDNYEFTRNIPKCVSVERLCEGANMQIPPKDEKSPSVTIP